MKVVIDTDPSIDDAMAFYFAHRSENIDLVGLATIFGNVAATDATTNAIWLGDSVNAGLVILGSATLVVPPKERPLRRF